MVVVGSNMEWICSGGGFRFRCGGEFSVLEDLDIVGGRFGWVLT